jgi:hypothetical protein
MILARVLQNQTNKPSRDRGDYVFLQVPGPGDHIQVLNERHLVDNWRPTHVKAEKVLKSTGRGLGQEASNKVGM